jgi:hypothetical protein
VLLAAVVGRAAARVIGSVQYERREPAPIEHGQPVNIGHEPVSAKRKLS